MRLPVEIENEYLRTVLANLSLEDLPGEKWEMIKDFENYTISNFGRVKSLERWVPNSLGGGQKIFDRIMKLQGIKYFNKHLNSHFYVVNCLLSSEGKSYGKSVARLVYYHFVEKFDLDDHSLLISNIDGNKFNLHFSNLEKLTVNKLRSKVLNMGRGKKGNYQQAVSQYTVDGDFVADYENIYEASKALEISPVYIFNVINKKRITSGEFLWFAKDYQPTQKDFLPESKNKKEEVLNVTLWKRLGQPAIDQTNPPALMNLSLKDLPGEIWKPIPEVEGYFTISNKGRIKRLNTWTRNSSMIFLKERIISIFVHVSDSNKYIFYTRLNCNGKRYNIIISRYVYYCFVEKFDLNDKILIIVNESHPQWKMDAAKLTLKSSSEILAERNKTYVPKVRTVVNSKKLFNDTLWQKLGKPGISKKNLPAVFDLSLKDRSDEYWKSLPGFEGKYSISNKGRVKRMSGWTVGMQFYGEDQIIPIQFREHRMTHLCFKLHQKEDRNVKMLFRLLYYCFVEEFNLDNDMIIVINENDRIWNIDLPKLLLCTRADAYDKENRKKK